MGWLLSLIPFIGQGIKAIADISARLTDLRIKQLEAKTEQQRIEIQGEIDRLQIQRDVLVAQDARNQTISNIVRIGFALPFAFYLWWIVAWDKIVCKWFVSSVSVGRVCSTDDLSANLWYICLAIIGYFYVTTLKR